MPKGDLTARCLSSQRETVILAVASFWPLRISQVESVSLSASGFLPWRCHFCSLRDKRQHSFSCFVKRGKLSGIIGHGSSFRVTWPKTSHCQFLSLTPVQHTQQCKRPIACIWCAPTFQILIPFSQNETICLGTSFYLNLRQSYILDNLLQSCIL